MSKVYSDLETYREDQKLRSWDVLAASGVLAGLVFGSLHVGYYVGAWNALHDSLISRSEWIDGLVMSAFILLAGLVWGVYSNTPAYKRQRIRSQEYDLERLVQQRKKGD